MITSSDSLRRTLSVGFVGECCVILYDLRWLIFLAVVLILTDLWFGLNASKYKGEEIRKSRAGRRTINKFIDYICYVLIGAGIGKAIGEPYGLNPITVSTAIIFLCYGFEIDSIYSHICTLHGIEKKFSIWKILWLLVRLKFKDLGDAFKEIQEQINNNKKK